MKVKILSNGETYKATVCDRTKIATVKMFGVNYKFSKHEYEVVGV